MLGSRRGGGNALRRRGHCSVDQVMEFGGVHDDLYVVEDSDLEYSDCSDEGR